MKVVVDSRGVIQTNPEEPTSFTVSGRTTFAGALLATDITGSGGLKVSGSAVVGAIGASNQQTNFQGGAFFSRRKWSFASNGAVCTGSISDYLVQITDTSGQVTYQMVPMGSTATKAAGIIVQDISFSSVYGSPLSRSIAILPPTGSKLNNVLNGSWSIVTSGGSATIFELDSGDVIVLGGT